MLRIPIRTKPLPHRVLRVEPPRRRAIIMDRRPPQVPPKPALEVPASRPVQRTPIIPDHHIPRIVPLDRRCVLLLRSMLIEPLNQLPRARDLLPGRPHLLDVVQVRADIQVHPPARLVALHQAVALHRRGPRRRGIDVLEELGRPELP